MASLKLIINSNLYLKDPQETALGKKITRNGILLIDSLGFEKFTFKKLAEQIDSTEASIYRYFENKHRLLVYLIAWYWNWLEYRIDYSTNNIDNPVERLRMALHIVGDHKSADEQFPDIDETALHRIVIAESDKTYLTKQVDSDNNEGCFRGVKSLCKKIAQYVSETDPTYPYPHALISTALEAAHQQLFFALHLPSLTELNKDDEGLYEKNKAFLTTLVLGQLNIGQQHA